MISGQGNLSPGKGIEEDEGPLSLMVAVLDHKVLLFTAYVLLFLQGNQNILAVPSLETPTHICDRRDIVITIPLAPRVIFG